MEHPIIFIHYGNSEYLKYTLRSAIKFNPGKKVYLLGDKENKHYEDIGVHHVEFQDLHYGEEIKKFEEIFKVIKGDQHEYNKYKGTDFWVRFVFLRWFYINNFIKANSISSFWTFDTDTLIISNLSSFEERLSLYDCTEQCSGSCMNGFVQNVNVVEGYVKHINYLFTDEEYLSTQQKDFEKNKSYAFTEMRAYLDYKLKSKIRTFKLGTVVNNEFFDDCLCIGDGMELNKLKDNNAFKKLYRTKGSKSLFVKKENKEEYIKLNTLNLSWLPIYIIRKIYSEVLKTHKQRVVPSPSLVFLPIDFDLLVAVNNLVNKSKFIFKKIIRIK